MDNFDDERTSGGVGIQAIFTAPIALPLMLIALILILVAVSRLSDGQWMSAFSLFLVGGVMAYVSQMLLG